jgi:hypothetical protein
MKVEPNLSTVWRVAFVVVGAALMVGPFLVSLGGWKWVVLPLLGVLSIATGATGW